MHSWRFSFFAARFSFFAAQAATSNFRDPTDKWPDHRSRHRVVQSQCDQ